MKLLFKSFFLFILLLISSVSFASTPIDTSLAPMLKKVLPSIVNIKAVIKITDFNTLRELQKQQDSSKKDNSNNANDNDSSLPDNYVSVGSGVIVDANRGYILTNAHVVNDAQTVTVTLNDAQHYTAKIIGLDKPSDVALLQIKAKNLIALPLGDSNQLKVGDFVAAIGNPFGLNQSVTSGIVSALGRTTLGIENYENFIQTDASINPGNSGGALINMQGQLVGINTAIIAPDKGSVGIGFAIPANMAKSVMAQLIEFGDVKRGILGIGAQDLTPDLAKAFHTEAKEGAAVTLVQIKSPAELAGLKMGDIIIAINDIPIKNASDVVNTIGFLRVESKATIEVLRLNQHIKLNVTLSDPKKRKQIIEETDPFFYGVSLKDFSLLSPIQGNIEGVLVVTVDEDSLAYNANIKPGDIITSANQQKISNIEELQLICKKANKQLLLNVIRGNNALFLVLNKEG